VDDATAGAYDNENALRISQDVGVSQRIEVSDLKKQWEKFMWLYLTITSECKQYSLDCHTDLWLHCGSHLIIIVFNISYFRHPLEKEVDSFCWAVTLPSFRRCLGCLKLFSDFHLSILGLRSQGLASLPDYYENLLF
jgi:hypothetical protein